MKLFPGYFPTLVAYRKLFCMNVLNGVVLLQDRRPTREAARVAYLLQVVSLKAQPSVGLLKLEA